MLLIYIHTQGDILLVADEFDDGWMRGLRLDDLEVSIVSNCCTPLSFPSSSQSLTSQIGFFPTSFVANDMSPVYKLK